jgi:hypothetical protein
MNVGIGTVAAQFLSCEYMFQIFSIMFLQCQCPVNSSHRARTPRHKTLLRLEYYVVLPCLGGCSVSGKTTTYIDSNLTEQVHHTVKLYSVVLPGLGGCSVPWKTTMLTPILQSKGTTLSNFTLLSCLAWVAALCQLGETTMLTPILQSKDTTLPKLTLS